MTVPTNFLEWAVLLMFFTLCCNECGGFSQPRSMIRNNLFPATDWFGHLPSKTALSMGLLENFVAGTDEKTRTAGNEKYLAKLQKRVDRINALEATIEDLGDDELQEKTNAFRQRLEDGEDINGPLLEEAFAVVREAAW